MAALPKLFKTKLLFATAMVGGKLILASSPSSHIVLPRTKKYGKFNFIPYFKSVDL